MTKKFLFIFMMLFGGVSLLQAATIPLKVGIEDDAPTMPGYPKSPIEPWYIDQNGYVLTMSATPCDYILTLYDENDVLVYSTFLSAGTSQVVLPATLSGNFEIRFETATYYYYGYISL